MLETLILGKDVLALGPGETMVIESDKFLRAKSWEGLNKCPAWLGKP